MSAIEIKELCKKFKDTEAVSGLNLKIEDGELFALLGTNGAGKTTTIRMLSCLIKPTSGDALLLGKSIVNNPNEVKKVINVSPQETAVAPNLTVFENLELIAGIYGSNGDEAKNRAEKMLAAFELEGVRNRRAKTLSGGMQRRLSIAMALITEPKILFLDEPTLGLDVIARRELWQTIRKLKGRVTIILTTHYLEEAEALSDRVGIMSKGKLCAVGTSAELKALADTECFEDAFIKLATGEGEKP